MILKNVSKFFAILGLQQAGNYSRRELAKRFVGRSKNREWPLTLQSFNEPGAG